MHLNITEPLIGTSRKRVLVGTLLVAMALLFQFALRPEFAHAGAGVGVAPTIDAGSVSVGQTAVASNIVITNTSTGTEATGTFTLTAGSIKFVPACGSAGDIHCTNAADKAPGVFSVSATGTGALGCTGISFTIAVTDATTGEVTFTPSAPVVLAAPNAGDTDQCQINFTVNVLALPTHDSNAVTAGVQTAQLVSVAGIANANGVPGTGTGTGQVTVSQLTPTVATSIHNAAHAVVTSVNAGTTVHDSVTVTGSGPTPTGNVTVSWFTNGTCTGAAAATSAATALVAGTVDVTAFTQTPATPGSYAFRASYAGNSAYTSATGPCEPLTVNALTPTVATSIHNAAHAVVTSVNAGTTVHDSVTVTGSGATPTGNVTVSWFTNGTCTGTAAATSTATALVAGTVDVTAFTQTPATAGSFAFRAAYAGDSVYSAATGPCEPLAVTVVGNQGCTPGYWKQSQHFDSWSGFTPTQTVNSVFSGVTGSFGSETLLTALQGGGGPGIDGAKEILLRAAVAAALNAQSPTVDYSLTLAQVVSQVNAAIASGDRNTMLTLAATLDAANNGIGGCPLN